jgi:hypothetical protein
MKQFITLLAICLSMAATASTSSTVENGKHSGSYFYKDNIKNELQVSSNHTTGSALVTFTAEKKGKGTIVVLDEAGNTVIRQAVSLLKGKNKINVSNFTHLQEGYYTVCLNTQYRTFSAPFLLWK